MAEKNQYISQHVKSVFAPVTGGIKKYKDKFKPFSASSIQSMVRHLSGQSILPGDVVPQVDGRVEPTYYLLAEDSSILSTESLPSLNIVTEESPY
jgi:hypothetical protein